MNRRVLAGIAVLVAGAAAWTWRGTAPAAPAPAGFEARAAAGHPAPPADLVVYVAGEVARPGVYRLAAGRRVVDALRAAGEAKPNADLVAVNLAEALRDGEEVVVPPNGAPAAPGRRRGGAARAPSRGGRRSGRGRKRAALPAAPLDLNAADAEALAALPGVGPGLAARIVAFRSANGPFDSVDALADVAGITDRRLEQIAPYLTIGGRP